MKFVIAPDSFKGSLSAQEAANAIADGILAVMPKAEIDKIPIADGGEGTVESLVSSTRGKLIEAAVLDPLGRKIRAKYGVLGDGITVVMEMAAASGLILLKQNELDPLNTSTYGTGQLIKHALLNGYRNFILGIGGSATNDGGAGMAQALGVKFHRSDNTEITEKMCGAWLGDVDDIDISNLHPAVKKSRFVIASDVNNPLLGSMGCANIYAKQKGASPEALIILEKNMANFIDIAENKLETSVRNVEGAGAAGGLSAGALLFMNAKIESGIDIILKTCNFSDRILDADLIITGEGKIDRQTQHGKTITGVVRKAKEQGVPVYAVGGSVEGGITAEDIGVDRIFSLAPEGKSVDYAMRNAYRLLKERIRIIIENI